MPIIFLFAVLCVALEDKVKINKGAIMILSAILLWSMLIFGADNILGSGLSEAFNNFIANVPSIKELPKEEQYFKFLVEYSFMENLGETTTTLFFVIGSMAIVEIVNAHGGFNAISRRLGVSTKRKFLCLISFVTFFLSAIVGDLATAIIMIAILRIFITERGERWIYAAMIIISANAGGSCSPIGDVTTILLWTGGNLTPLHQLSSLLLPSLVCMVVPLSLSLFYLKRGDKLPQRGVSEQKSRIPLVNHKFRTIILVLGVGSLICVPIFNEVTKLPPFMGVMGGLAIIWAYVDIVYGHISCIKEEDRATVPSLLTHLDMATILFFFGILMSVSALNVAGDLQLISSFLSETFSDNKMIAFVLGIASSFLDNVALVAATMGMYPLADGSSTDPKVLEYAVNSEFWTFISYCCVTGGSVLIIGSATGVSVMGMEKMTFGYYLKKFTLLALLGYIAGALVYIFLIAH